MGPADVKHAHEIDGQLHEDCVACDYIRGRTGASRLKAEREVDADFGGIMKTALKAKRGT